MPREIIDFVGMGEPVPTKSLSHGHRKPPIPYGYLDGIFRRCLR
jgi:hypothetical protein